MLEPEGELGVVGGGVVGVDAVDREQLGIHGSGGLATGQVDFVGRREEVTVQVVPAVLQGPDAVDAPFAPCAKAEGSRPSASARAAPEFSS